MGISKSFPGRVVSPLTNVTGDLSFGGAIVYWLDAHSPLGRSPADPAVVYELFTKCDNHAPLGAAVVLTKERDHIRVWTNCPCSLQNSCSDSGDVGVLFEIWPIMQMPMVIEYLGRTFKITPFDPVGGVEIVVVTQKVRK